MQSAGGQDSVEILVRQVLRCTDVIASQIVSQARQGQHRPNSVLIHQGEETNQVFLTITGLARAMLTSEAGLLVFIAEYIRGDLFGDLQMGETGEQDAEVMAITDLRTLQIDGRVLAGFGERHGSIGLALSRILFARLRRSTRQVYERTALSASGRVYAELQRLGQAHDNIIAPVPVVSDLALRVGTTRETASRCLSSLTRRGIITRDDGALRILAPARLSDLVF